MEQNSPREYFRVLDGFARIVNQYPSTTSEQVRDCTVRYFKKTDVVTSDQLRHSGFRRVLFHPFKIEPVYNKDDILERLHWQTTRDIEILAAHTYLSLRERLLHHFSFLSETVHYSCKNDQPFLRITQAQVATDINSTRESTTKVMRQLVKEGYIMTNYRKIFLLRGE